MMVTNTLAHIILRTLINARPLAFLLQEIWHPAGGLCAVVLILFDHALGQNIALVCLVGVDMCPLSSNIGMLALEI